MGFFGVDTQTSAISVSSASPNQALTFTPAISIIVDSPEAGMTAETRGQTTAEPKHKTYVPISQTQANPTAFGLPAFTPQPDVTPITDIDDQYPRQMGFNFKNILLIGGLVIVGSIFIKNLKKVKK